MKRLARAAEVWIWARVAAEALSVAVGAAVFAAMWAVVRYCAAVLLR
jgi:hypothetical protein